MQAPRRASRPKSKTVLEIDTFGRLDLRVSGAPCLISGRKSLALVGYLAMSEQAEEARERLVGLLWSEVDEGKARASLRQTLHEIRAAFSAVGFDGIIADKHVIGLDRDRIDVDLRRILNDAEHGSVNPHLLKAAPHFENLLERYETVDPSYRVWIIAKRQSMHDRVLRSLERILRGSGTPEAQEQAARIILKLDPTHEEAARAFMQGRVVAGDIGGALSAYKSLWDLLQNEYDIEPSQETQDFIAALRQSQPEPNLPRQSLTGDRASVDVRSAETQTRPAGADARDARLILAVGSFESAGHADSARHLVQGFRSELIASLVRFREWLVRDIGGRPQDLTGSHRSEYIIEGHALPSPHELRMVLTLREAHTNIYLWGERLTVSVASWSDAQQSIIRRISAALNVHVSAGRLATISPAAKTNLTCYDRWLRAQVRMLSFSAEDWHEAAKTFREIIAETPTFAPAYSSLAQLNNAIHLCHHGVFRNRERCTEALTCAREAAKLDPIDSRSHLALGWAHLMANQHDLAAIHYTIAEELNDNDPWTLVSSGLGFAFSGDNLRARELADRALALTVGPGPTHWGYQMRIRFLGGDLAGAREAALQAADVPAFPGWNAALLCALGDMEPAAAELERFYRIANGNWVGDGASSRDAIVRWFLHSFPIKVRKDWERLRELLVAAGAPAGSLGHEICDIGSVTAGHMHMPIE